MIKRIIFSVVFLFSFALSFAQEKSYDKARFSNGLEQIANSNRNYFKNAGWIEDSWYVLSNWYPDVLLINTTEKYELAKVINSPDVIKRYEALNAKKKSGETLSFQEVEEFNIFLWNALEGKVKEMYK